MTSTQLKKSRKWLSLMASLKMTGKNNTKFTPPMWAFAYKLSTVAESNEKGSWSGWVVEKDEQVTDLNIYSAAKEFAKAVKAGVVTVKAPPSDEASESEKPF